jgi:hypothetical protein
MYTSYKISTQVLFDRVAFIIHLAGVGVEVATLGASNDPSSFIMPPFWISSEAEPYKAQVSVFSQTHFT